MSTCQLRTRGGGKRPRDGRREPTHMGLRTLDLYGFERARQDSAFESVLIVNRHTTIRGNSDVEDQIFGSTAILIAKQRPANINLRNNQSTLGIVIPFDHLVIAEEPETKPDEAAVGDDMA